MTRHRIRIATATLVAVTLLTAVAIVPAAPHAASAPAAPQGLTGISLSARVALAWSPSPDATSYQVYRGTSAGAITTLVSPAGLAATSFTDTTAANNTTYYYTVRATNADGQSGVNQRVTVRPRSRSCSSTNRVREENCYPGTTAWKSAGATRAYPTGIEGFLSASSVNAGGRVDLRVTTGDWDTPYRVEIYRTGNYGGNQGRLVSTILPGVDGQIGFCQNRHTTTGLTDCSDFERTATIATTADWVSGVYLIKLIRQDNGEHSEVPLVVRQDGSTSDVLFGVPTSTYQAYNAFGGKSLYSWSSDGPTTVSGANRAVEASFDRPYSQPASPSTAHDYYTRADLGTVAWLEAQGYSTTYIASEDLHTHGAQLTAHRVFISGAHDEYWSQEMFDAAIAARNAGTSLLFTGANATYWRVRFTPSPITGVANRVMVVYKTIESGGPDPSGTSTSTWRDPAGPNRPENELLGQQYIGDNASADFPLRVSAAEGRNRVWRYTDASNLAAGTTASIGTSIVGWEWDARADNGREPAGVETVATSPVTGNLVQGNGGAYLYGNANANATIYRAASGARVFATGTNNWWRGLALNLHGQGEPNVRVQQATVNVLTDMGVRPATPAAGLTVDALGAPGISARTPAPNATGVALGSTVTVTLNKPLDPSTVDATDLTLKAGTVAVPATVTLDSTTRTITLRPTELLEPNTVYTARLGNAIKTWAGTSPSGASSWNFTAGPGSPPTVLSTTPAAGTGGVFTDAAVSARFDRRLDPASVTTGSFTLRPAAGGAPVAATVTYDGATRTARLQPTARLAPSTAYTAELTTGVRATDGLAMTAPATWTITTGTEVTVTSRFPAAGGTGLSPQTNVRAVFSRPVDAATVTAAAVQVTGPGGQAVSGQVVFDPGTRTATLLPATALASGTTYTVSAGTGVRGADGAPTEGSTWTFATAATPPPPPAATSYFPPAGATDVANGVAVKVAFDRALDPASVTPQSVTLAPAGGSPVAAAVTYDDAARRITLTPMSALDPGVQYTATVSTLVRSTTGAPPATALTWSFTAASCPCALMTNLTPAWTGIATRDGRPDPGPWTYELGTRVTATADARLVALRFWKEPGETGTHVGRVWSSTGQLLASSTYQSESASGWQRQALATPLTLQAGQTYVLSVGLNSVYAKTTGGLAAQLSAGPLRTATGGNGVFNQTAGQFPTESWESSNYFVDGVVTLPSAPQRTPQVEAQSPMAGATGVPVATQVSARFTTRLDPATVTSTTFRLTTPQGAAVAAHVSYDDDVRTATLVPDAPLANGVAYTARLTTGIRSEDETPLPAAVNWTFSTIPPGPPVVTAESPTDGSTDLSATLLVSATFSQPMDAATLTDATFTLTGPSGAAVPATVDYDPVMRVATLEPNAPLASATPYIARLDTGVRSAAGVALAQAHTWAFTTSNCPCSLFDDSRQFTMTDLSTANGRAGGPWTLEMGMKLGVTQAAQLEAIRFHKSPGETGSHTGRVWTGSGQLLASVAFTGESASGWQQQALATPVPLTPGQTYVVSVGINERFVMTVGGLGSSVASGPLFSVDDGANGVYADDAGAFPTNHWGESDYGIDAVVR